MADVDKNAWYPVGGNGGIPSDCFDSSVINRRRIKVDNGNADGGGISSLGETIVAEKMPVVQITAQSGFTNKILPLSLNGGSYSSSDAMFSVSSGTNQNSVAAVLSQKEISARAGQSICCIFSAIFSDGIIGNTQQAGLITSETAFAFGFDGVDFGILHAKDGALEIRDLTITSSPVAPENATVTLDGIAYVIPITNTSINQNAYEIATYLDANQTRYRATSNTNKVTVLAQLPELGSGAFSFSSATAAASFTQIQDASPGTNTWYKKEDWNVRPDFNIDKTKGNVYKIQYAFTGFDGIEFFIKNYETNDFELVHVIRYGNSNISPSSKNPIFRCGWATRNYANTTSVTVKGASISAANEGMRIYDYDSVGISNSLNIGTALIDYNVITLRVRRVFNNTVNRSKSLAIALNLTTESTKTTKFKIIKNPIVATGGYLNFSYANNSTSLIEVAKNLVQITGGQVLGEYDTLLDKEIDLSKILVQLSVGDVYAVTAQVKNGATGDVSAIINLRDDL